MEIKKLEINKTYRVINHNCHLTKLIRKGERIWRFVKIGLRRGDLILYHGQEEDFRNGNQPHDVFSKGGFRGWFYPHDSDTGMADCEYLEEADNLE